MNFDRLAQDLFDEFRKVKTQTRAGCPESEDGGVMSVEVRYGERTWRLWQEDEVVRVIEEWPTTYRVERRFTDRGHVVEWIKGRAYATVPGTRETEVMG